MSVHNGGSYTEISLALMLPVQKLEDEFIPIERWSERGERWSYEKCQITYNSLWFVAICIFCGEKDCKNDLIKLLTVIDVKWAWRVKRFCFSKGFLQSETCIKFCFIGFTHCSLTTFSSLTTVVLIIALVLLIREWSNHQTRNLHLFSYRDFFERKR